MAFTNEFICIQRRERQGCTGVARAAPTSPRLAVRAQISGTRLTAGPRAASPPSPGAAAGRQVRAPSLALPPWPAGVAGSWPCRQLAASRCRRAPPRRAAAISRTAERAELGGSGRRYGRTGWREARCGPGHARPGEATCPRLWGCFSQGSSVPSRKRNPPEPRSFFSVGRLRQSSPSGGFYPGGDKDLWSLAGAASGHRESNFTAEKQARRSFSADFCCLLMLTWKIRALLLLLLLLLLLSLSLLLFRFGGAQVWSGKDCFKLLFSNRHTYRTFIITLHTESQEGTGFFLLFFLLISEFLTN